MCAVGVTPASLRPRLPPPPFNPGHVMVTGRILDADGVRSRSKQKSPGPSSGTAIASEHHPPHADHAAETAMVIPGRQRRCPRESRQGLNIAAVGCTGLAWYSRPPKGAAETAKRRVITTHIRQAGTHKWLAPNADQPGQSNTAPVARIIIAQ